VIEQLLPEITGRAENGWFSSCALGRKVTSVAADKGVLTMNRYEKSIGSCWQMALSPGLAKVIPGQRTTGARV
jgi:hypothetical protein